MADRTINDEIQIIVDHTLQQQPKPEKIYITKIYEDQKHIDCKNTNGDIITYVPIIANNPSVNNIGILIFLENNEKMVITKWKLKETKATNTKVAHTVSIAIK